MIIDLDMRPSQFCQRLLVHEKRLWEACQVIYHRELGHFRKWVWDTTHLLQLAQSLLGRKGDRGHLLSQKCVV
jgi:hypothetical protein